MEALLVNAGEIALEALPGKLIGEIKKVKDKAKQYKILLGRMEETLDSLAHNLKAIEEYDRILDRPDEQDNQRLRKTLEDGIVLVRKCGENVRWWNCCYTKPKYADELERLEQSLLHFIQTTMQLQQRRDFLALAVQINRWHPTVAAGEGNSRIVSTSAVPQAPKFVVGLEVHLRKLKLQLLEDRASVCILSAPGGRGKTTLAKMLCHDEKIEKEFKDNIFFIEVSRTPNLKAMVQKIFQYKSPQVPEFQSDEDAINQLKELLQSIQRPILLVLDDVWSGSESVIDQFCMQIKDYKILVTSRSVLQGFPSTYDLARLSKEDAKTLFLHAVSSGYENFYMPDDLVDEVIEACKRLPLALNVTGRSLRGKREADWRKRLRDWSNGRFTSDSDGEILNCLKKSFDILDTEMKDCFMDLGSFPEDQKISAQALIDMWAVLYDKDEDGVYAMANIYHLCDRNLARLAITRDLKTEFDNCYYGHFVMQHDLLRELAIYQSSLNQIEDRQKLLINITGDSFPNWWKEQTSASLLSISTDEMFSSKWLSIEAPDVKVIILNFQSKSYILPHFVDNMMKAEALIATNYGYYPAELSNFQVLASLPSIRRIRLEKVAFPFLRNPSLQYRTLQKITLVLCRFEEGFKNFDIANAFPNLTEFNVDYSSDLVDIPPSLCNILTLRKLRLTNCPGLIGLPEEMKKLTNLEELRLGSCTNLKMLPNSFGNLKNLKFLDISYCLKISKMPDDIGDLHHLRILHMKNCLDLEEVPTSAKNLRNLKVICDERREALWRPFQHSIVNLKIVVHAEEINLNWKL